MFGLPYAVQVLPLLVDGVAVGEFCAARAPPLLVEVVVVGVVLVAPVPLVLAAENVARSFVARALA